MERPFKLPFGFLLLLFYLFSCQSEKEKEVYRIGFSQAMTTDNWRKAMNREMEVEASMHSNISLEIKDAENDVEKQIAQINSFIEEGVDVLIVSAIQSQPITSVIEKAMAADIPTIVIDRKIEGSNYTAYVGANNIQIGESAANYILAHTLDSTSIVEIKGQEGSSPAYERSEGFNSVISKNPRAIIVGEINGNWEEESMQAELDSLLQSIPTPDFIFAHNDRMALGAWEVAKKLGIHNKIRFLGVDGLFGPSGGIQLVKENILDATILYPTAGTEAIKTAKRLAEGEGVNKNIILNSVVIDPVNVDMMKNQFEKLQQQQKDIEQQQVVIADQVSTYKSQSNLVRLMIGLLIMLFVLSVWSVILVLRLKKSKRNLEATNKKVIEQKNQIEDFAEKLKLSNESRINFFTALSHEFKTPLTLITSAIETISEASKGRTREFAYENSLIINNSKRLLRLINDLLNFRKLETGSFSIRPVNTNLHDFLEKVVKNFRAIAVQKSINLKLKSFDPTLKLYFDRSLMDKVFFNLLSNALKFTPKNGKISIVVEEGREGEVIIKVQDSGIGIPRNEYQTIFDPFVQGSNNLNQSSGLGLYITKEFVELHKGSISVSSHQGTLFTIILLKGKEHLQEYNPSEIEVDLIIQEFEQIEESQIKLSDDQVDIGGADLDNILIIDDNPDLSYLLKKNLSGEFQVFLSDGSDAVEKAIDLVPDIIICDINLPGKSGYEICRELKDDLRTSHIPIIVLSALSTEEAKIKSLKSGADSFISKPFNFQVLRESLRSALYNREKLRYYYTNNIGQIKDDKFENAEQHFLKDLNTLIEENLRNTDFSVEDLAQRLNISRVQLYRKVKALLGITVSEYINSTRLNKGKYLLQETELNISEIAYSVGYSSPGYFSTSFKNKFGITPKQLRE